MQRRGAVLRQRSHRKAAAEHRSYSRNVVVAGRVGNLTRGLGTCSIYEVRIDRKHRVGALVIAAPKCIKQAIEWTRPLQQQFQHLGVATLAGDVESRDVEPERPLVNMSAIGGGIDHRKPVLINSHGN
jgi:hypothetical protein